MLTCFSHAPSWDGTLDTVVEGLIRQAGRLYEAGFFGAVWPVCDFKLKQSCVGGNQSKVYSYIRIFYYKEWRLLDNKVLFSNLTNVIMKSKWAFPVMLMHDGSLHLNSLIVYFILLYIHSSQHHLHFHTCFSSEEFRLVSEYQCRSN